MNARLTIDLDALAANHACLAEAAGGAEVAPVVKAEGYGLGAAPVARRLHAEGARSFFVARVAEGEALRQALGARSAVIYVLDGVPAGAGERLQVATLTPVLNSLTQVEAWHACGGGPAALHVDTGMNRLGLTLSQAEAFAERRDHLNVTLVMSHLACADDPAEPMNARQLAAFRQARALFPDARASLANSAGVFLGDDYRFDVVRPGISLYGGGPQGRSDRRIRAVATFEAPVLQVRSVQRGETIGYGAAFTAKRPLRAAILAAGYADGVLRSGSPAGFAVLNGRTCAFLGRVSMDLIAIDATDAEAQPGDLAQLLGRDAPLDELAAAAGTIAYEVLTRLGPRAERRYLGAVG